MDRKEYLDEISASSRPVSKPKKSFLSSKFLWIGLAGIAAFVIIAIIGALISGSRTSVKDRLFALIIHIDNVSGVIDEYQPSIKSSSLRSDSASLGTNLGSDNKALTDYATAKYNFKTKDVKKSIQEEETLAKDALMSELFEAKINGLLDDTYAYKMSYEISLIMAREEQLMKDSSTPELRAILGTSYKNLENLYSKFDNYSGVK